MGDYKAPTTAAALTVSIPGGRPVQITTNAADPGVVTLDVNQELKASDPRVRFASEQARELGRALILAADITDRCLW